MTPSDLADLDTNDIARDLFDAAADPWWRLERLDKQRFNWCCLRRATNWPVSAGYLVALHEVSSRAQAKAFASQNRTWIHEEGAVHCRGAAELAIVCSKHTPPPLRENMFSIHLENSIVANVGYATLLYRRLVAQPAAEEYQRLPDPTTMSTLVITGVEKAELLGVAEMCLYHLRNRFSDVRFNFWPVSILHRAPEADDEDLSHHGAPDSGELPLSKRPEAVAFYNRAGETDSITAFLYYYRVLEACFDDVLRDEIAAWRNDKSIDDLDLMKNFRSMNQREDLKALRSMLGQIVDQQMLDAVHRQQLISEATADALAQGIYTRRNSIAHGRKGQHVEVLVPFAFGDEMRHMSWRDVMGTLAKKALIRWIVPGR